MFEYRQEVEVDTPLFGWLPGIVVEVCNHECRVYISSADTLDWYNFELIRDTQKKYWFYFNQTIQSWLITSVGGWRIERRKSCIYATDERDAQRIEDKILGDLEVDDV